MNENQEIYLTFCKMNEGISREELTKKWSEYCKDKCFAECDIATRKWLAIQIEDDFAYTREEMDQQFVNLHNKIKND